MPVSTTSRQARSAAKDSMPSRGDRAAVEADLVGEPLGVQPPALVERAQLGVEVAPVARDVERLRGRELQVVPGHRLVERERLVLVAVALARVGRQQAVRAGAAAVDGRRPVVRQRGVVRVDRVDLLDDAAGDVVVLEVGVARGLGPVEGVLGDRDDLLAGAEAQRRVRRASARRWWRSRSRRAPPARSSTTARPARRVPRARSRGSPRGESVVVVCRATAAR